MGFTKKTQQQGPRHLFIPDTQCKPNEDLSHLEWFGKYAAYKKPDVITLAGDHYDLQSLSSYDAGRLASHGKYLEDDLHAGDEGLRIFDAALKKYSPKGYKPRKVVTLGNHECVSPDTEILTKKGWVPAEQISFEHDIASYTQGEGTVSFAKPVAITKRDSVPLYSLTGDFNADSISDSHRIDYQGKLTEVKSAPDNINQTELRHSGMLDLSEQRELPVSDVVLRILVWIVCDGTIVYKKGGSVRIQFKLSKQRKIDRLSRLLKEANIDFTFKPATMSGINKLQPYYIRIYGQFARDLVKHLGGTKSFDERWQWIGERQFRQVLEEISHTDGTRHYNKIAWTTTSKTDADNILTAAILSGVPAKVRSLINASGFANAKLQYHLSFADRGLFNRRYVDCKPAGNGPVVAIETQLGTLVTRREGKVSFTGNSRLTRHVNEHPELKGMFGLQSFGFKKYGWEVHDFLHPVEIHGITYCHFFPLNATGRVTNSKNGAPSALAQVRRMMRNCVAGHQQGLDTASLTTPGRIIRGVISGSAYVHEESYIPKIGDSYWRGVLILNDIGPKNGFDLCEVSMDYLRRKYG